MSLVVRHPTVLGEFKPFGLTAEALDGKPSGNVPKKYDYFLLDPEITRERNDLFAAGHDFSIPALYSNRSDHELFIRGNRIIWSMGSQVHKRYTSPNSILMVCLFRMDAISDALLCLLRIGTLSMYDASGKVVSIPLPFAIAHIWPFPFGLLLQNSMDGNCPISS